MSMMRVIALSFACVFALVAGAASATADSLVNSYDFTAGLGDTLGNGLDLVASGGTVAGGRYTFDANEGLRLDSALGQTDDYRIDIRFHMDVNAGYWKKVLDFQGLGSDHGLYVGGDSIRFYDTTAEGAATLAIGQDVTVSLVRDGGTDIVTGFVDGVQQWSFLDGGNKAVSVANVLNFFEDDFSTGQAEAFPGSVDWIRIYDGAVVPEPGSMALLGLGVAGLAFLRRRRS